jgi:hypothetical protein
MPESSLSDCLVALHMGLMPYGRTEEEPTMIVAEPGDRFDLSDSVWIERFTKNFAVCVQNACQPAHHKIGPFSIDGHMYAFVRKASTGKENLNESVLQLSASFALSRLVHPTSVGDRYFAQPFVLRDEDAPIRAITIRGRSADAFLSPGERDWLSTEDGEALRKLMPWVETDDLMHPRVHHAYWNHEYAMRSYDMDTRWTLVVAGLEALINVDESKTAQQFCGRVLQLAREFGIDSTEKELKLAYKLRSKLVHAQSFLVGLGAILPTNEHTPLYEKLELILRSTVKRALLEPAFGDYFRDGNAVKARWQL